MNNEQKMIHPQATYELSGEALARVARMLQDFPRSMSQICEQIEQQLSTCTEIVDTAEQEIPAPAAPAPN